MAALDVVLDPDGAGAIVIAHITSEEVDFLYFVAHDMYLRAEFASEAEDWPEFIQAGTTARTFHDVADRLRP